MLVLLLMAVTGAWAKTIDLSTVTTKTTANNDDVLTGTLGKNVQISIADGATVTLNNVSINADGVSSLAANKGNGAPYNIGAGLNGTCGTITLTLADNVNNGSTLTSFNGITADVTLKRTLQKDGWNTFCAPFDISPIPTGWTLKELTGSSFNSSTGELTLNFGDAVSIEAGRAYLVKVDANVANPTFEGVTIANVTTTTETTNADFVPVMNPTPLTANDKTVLFVTGGNKLTYPLTTGNINGFRAYFQLKGFAAEARSFTMSFDDESTGITDIYDSQAHDLRFDTDGIYTLDGRRIEGQPTAKGIYIQNGRKVIIQ